MPLTAFEYVCFCGAFLWLNALPATVFILELILLFVNDFDDLEAAVLLVTFLFAIIFSLFYFLFPHPRMVRAS